MSTQQDEFFIGWQGKAPEMTGKFLRGRVILAALAAIIIAAGVAFLQQTMTNAAWDYTDVKEFQGLLVESPVPMLLSENASENGGEAVYLLVNPFKYGYSAEKAKEFHLKPVTIKGTLIHHPDHGAMIQVVDTQPREVAQGSAAPLAAQSESQVELSGEIVDSKCWLGVMNPGSLKPHRACAINCIKGGIPPLLLVDRKDMFILVGANGEPINEAILDLVALPVTISGKLVDYGAIKVLKADPAAIQLTP